MVAGGASTGEPSAVVVVGVRLTDGAAEAESSLGRLLGQAGEYRVGHVAEDDGALVRVLVRE